MYGSLIFLLSILLATITFAGGKSKRPSPERCNNVIQMGLMNNLISSGKLAEHFPGMRKESIEFLQADFNRVRQATDAAIRSGKAPPDHLIDQLIQRTNLTEPTKGKHSVTQGQSDLIGAGTRRRHLEGVEEEKVAHSLSDMGYDVKFNDGTNIQPSRLKKEGLNPNKNPDLEINGQIFDIYTTHSDTHTAVDGVIEKIRAGQTHRVVINNSSGRDSGSAMNQIRKELHERNPEGLHEVLVLRHNNGIPELVRVFP